MRAILIVMVLAAVCSCRLKENRWDWNGVPEGAACHETDSGTDLYICISRGVRYDCVVNRNGKHETDDAIVTPVECARSTPVQPSEAP